jgi:hypothetical protein
MEEGGGEAAEYILSLFCFLFSLFLVFFEKIFLKKFNPAFGRVVTFAFESSAGPSARLNFRRSILP